MVKTLIERLVRECEIALDNNLYLVALNTALTLPDICGKAEYQNLNTSERYKKWYQENIGQYEKCPDDAKYGWDFPYLSDTVVYDLRCSLLHQGTPNVKKEKTDIDKFVLLIEEKNEFGIYMSVADLSERNGCIKKEYRVNVRALCISLCRAAENYYRENKGKFDFFNYYIEDLDKIKQVYKEKHKEIELENSEMEALKKGRL